MHHLASDTINRTLLAAALAMSLFGLANMVLTRELAQVVSLMIMVIGAVRFHVLQGQRGVFLSRFLSPNIARLINRGDLNEVMADSDREISIVCADIRNFTHFSSNTETAAVMQFLREYYDAVAAAPAWGRFLWTAVPANLLASSSLRLRSRRVCRVG